MEIPDKSAPHSDEAKWVVHWPTLGCPQVKHWCEPTTEFQKKWVSAPHGEAD